MPVGEMKSLKTSCVHNSSAIGWLRILKKNRRARLMRARLCNSIVSLRYIGACGPGATSTIFLPRGRSVAVLSLLLRLLPLRLRCRVFRGSPSHFIIPLPLRPRLLLQRVLGPIRFPV